MATSRKQCNTVIDRTHHEWYKRIAKDNPFITMMGMMREAHAVYQQNYALLKRFQRRLQDDGVYVSNADLIGRLLRKEIYKNLDVSDVTTVNEEFTTVTRVNT